MGKLFEFFRMLYYIYVNVISSKKNYLVRRLVRTNLLGSFLGGKCNAKKEKIFVGCGEIKWPRLLQ